MMQVGIGEHSMLIGTEEASFNKALKHLQDMVLEYYKDMEKRGYMNNGEKKLLKQGVMFKTIKRQAFGMREEDLKERTHLIKTG